MKMSGQDIEAMAAMSPAAAGAMVGLQMRDDEIAHLRALVEELAGALEVEMGYWNSEALRYADLPSEAWQVRVLEARRTSIGAALAKVRQAMGEKP